MLSPTLSGPAVDTSSRLISHGVRTKCGGLERRAHWGHRGREMGTLGVQGQGAQLREEQEQKQTHLTTYLAKREEGKSKEDKAGAGETAHPLGAPLLCRRTCVQFPSSTYSSQLSVIPVAGDLTGSHRRTGGGTQSLSCQPQAPRLAKMASRCFIEGG